MKNGYTFSMELGSYYAYSLPEYAAKGASRISYFCNDAVGECSPSDIQGLNNSARENGMQVIAFNYIDSKVSNYKESMMAAVDAAKNSDADVIVIVDYDVLCIDIVDYMRAINWTPRGLYLVDCNDGPVALEAIGELYIQYSSSYLSFVNDANYTSGNTIAREEFVLILSC